MKNWKFALLGTAALAIAPAVSNAAFTDYTGLDGGGWSVDYQLHITTSSAFSGGVPYDTNNSGSIAPGSYDRVAYVLEINNQYVFASFDPQSALATQLGVPNLTSGEFYQQNVNNLHVLAGGGAPVTTGVFAGPSGNLEFWPTDYQTNNSAGVPGASNGVYDSGDQPTPGSYGSMQIHNHNVDNAGTQTLPNETLIAFNQWNGGGGEVGLGNQVGGSGHPDWTFSNNRFNAIQDIQVLVHVVPEPATLSMLGLGAVGLLARRRHA